MLSYRSVLPLSSNTLRYVAKLITAYRSQIRSRWRRLSASRQAVLVLAYLHDNLPFTRLAASFTVGVATAWRYVQETIGLLAMRAPSLAEALRTATGSGWGLVLMDGTL
ncbi:MAG: transposase family protein, partial [Mycobacteriales bacterium]